LPADEGGKKRSVRSCGCGNRCGSATIPAAPPGEKKVSASHGRPKEEVKLAAPPQSML
jgi:hypothetical protein